jgi:hypothetical protein
MRHLTIGLLLAGLVSLPRTAAAQGGEPEQSPSAGEGFQATGTVMFHPSGGGASGASFDQDRVVGPGVNMSLDEGGTWSGNLGDADVVLTVSPQKLFGAGMSVALSRKDDSLSVEGLAFGQRVRLELDGKKLHGRYGACSFDLKRRSRDVLTGSVGCFRGRRGTSPVTAQATLQLAGDAAEPAPPLPQMVLALLSALPN